MWKLGQFRGFLKAGRLAASTKKGRCLINKPYEKTRSLGYKLVSLCLLSIALILVDHLTNWTDWLHSHVFLLASPVVNVAKMPLRAYENLAEFAVNRSQLLDRLEVLEKENLVQKAETAQMTALKVENAHLRRLLGSTQQLQNSVMIAEIIGINPNPDRHEIIINKGENQGVGRGQTVINEWGLMGQVIHTSLLQSRVLLITDPTHSVPVQVTRNKLRLIARGAGHNQQLEILHVNTTADIKTGDHLSSSGLGARFPAGYPVGMVNQVSHQPGEAFAQVLATTSARVDQGRHVLLLFPGTTAKLDPGIMEEGRVRARQEPSGRLR